jgi:hypothetical protein
MWVKISLGGEGVVPEYLIPISPLPLGERIQVRGISGDEQGLSLADRGLYKHG